MGAGHTGIYGQNCGCAYPASKGAVIMLTKSLANELGKDNIRVCAVAPGLIETEMLAVVPIEAKQPYIDAIPLARLGQSAADAVAVSCDRSSGLKAFAFKRPVSDEEINI